MKKSKKFVLAGLALLAAITMVLLPLAGCKNDSVPETPAAKLVSISVTSPARTVYSVGQSFDPTGMKVTATYDDGEERTVTGWTTNFGTVVAEKGLDKEVTVSYKDRETTKTTTFTVTVFPAEVKVLTGYTNPNHTDSEWIYVEFGEWPQTIKADSVSVYETESKKMGMFTYYLGDDDNYYVKITAKPYVDTYTYSDGSPVEKYEEVYFKVEPIVWRVLTTSYEAPEDGTVGEILLLAESILTGGVPYYDVYDVNRTVGEATIYPNNYEHSAVRAWLNGLKYPYKWSDGEEQIDKEDYFGKGFLQTAFTEYARKLIADTTVDNSTADKIFLLSQQEATNSEYGFGAYSEEDSARIRVTTDYAKATGAEQDSTPGYGGWWWLRSPLYGDDSRARVIHNDGLADIDDIPVDDPDEGVVPALSISL